MENQGVSTLAEVLKRHKVTRSTIARWQVPKEEGGRGFPYWMKPKGSRFKCEVLNHLMYEWEEREGIVIAPQDEAPKSEAAE